MRITTKRLRDALDVIEYGITGAPSHLITLEATPEGYLVRSYPNECHECRVRAEANRQIGLHHDSILIPTTQHRVHAHPACYDFMGHGPDRIR